MFFSQVVIQSLKWLPVQNTTVNSDTKLVNDDTCVVKGNAWMMFCFFSQVATQVLKWLPIQNTTVSGDTKVVNCATCVVNCQTWVVNLGLTWL